MSFATLRNLTKPNNKASRLAKSISHHPSQVKNRDGLDINEVFQHTHIIFEVSNIDLHFLFSYFEQQLKEENNNYAQDEENWFSKVSVEEGITVGGLIQKIQLHFIKTFFPSLVSNFQNYLTIFSDFAITAEDDTQPFHLKTPLSSLSFGKFKYHRVSQTVNIILEDGREKGLEFPSNISIAQLIQQIYKYDWACDYQMKSLSLYLYQKPNIRNRTKGYKGILLDLQRTLASYRLSPSDKLYFAESEFVTQSKIMPSNFIPSSNTHTYILHFSVYDDETATQKTIKFEGNMEVKRCVYYFLSKINYLHVRNADKYGFYLFENNELLYLPNETPISSFELPPLTRLVCRKLHWLPEAVFGIDPSRLPHVNDDGVEVPEVIVILKNKLIELNGLTAEGIFRKTGNESDIVENKNLLNTFSPLITNDPHTIASLLKRWFKELPCSLLASVPSELAENEQRIKEIEDHLSEEHKNIYIWIFNFLAEIAQRKEVNLMDTKNLGIVWGPNLPIVPPGDLSDPFLCFSLNSISVTLVERIIAYTLANPRPPLPPPLLFFSIPSMPPSDYLKQKKMPKPPSLSSSDNNNNNNNDNNNNDDYNNRSDINDIDHDDENTYNNNNNNNINNNNNSSDSNDENTEKNIDKTVKWKGGKLSSSQKLPNEQHSFLIPSQSMPSLKAFADRDRSFSHEWIYAKQKKNKENKEKNKEKKKEKSNTTTGIIPPPPVHPAPPPPLSNFFPPPLDLPPPPPPLSSSTLNVENSLQKARKNSAPNLYALSIGLVDERGNSLDKSFETPDSSHDNSKEGPLNNTIRRSNSIDAFNKASRKKEKSKQKKLENFPPYPAPLAPTWRPLVLNSALQPLDPSSLSKPIPKPPTQ